MLFFLINKRKVYLYIIQSKSYSLKVIAINIKNKHKKHLFMISTEIRKRLYIFSISNYYR